MPHQTGSNSKYIISANKWKVHIADWRGGIYTLLCVYGGTMEVYERHIICVKTKKKQLPFRSDKQ